jgi:hypothetical protein
VVVSQEEIEHPGAALVKTLTEEEHILVPDVFTERPRSVIYVGPVHRCIH